MSEKGLILTDCCFAPTISGKPEDKYYHRCSKCGKETSVHWSKSDLKPIKEKENTDARNKCQTSQRDH
jgi:hypothetical protein